MDIKNEALKKVLIVAMCLLPIIVGWLSYLFTSWYWEMLLNKEVVKYEAKLAEIDRESNRELILQQSKRAELQEKLAVIEKQQYEELASGKIKIDQLISDLSATRKRLSIATASCKTSSSKLSGSTKSSSMDYDPTRAYLDSGDAANIIRITRRGDEAIRQLTACQQYIKAVAEK